MEWAEKELLETLPHGSGIDGKWYIEKDMVRPVFHCYNEYHAMNEDGCYVTWLPFEAEVPIDKEGYKDAYVKFSDMTNEDIDELEKFGVYVDLLLEYLDDVIYYCLYDAVEGRWEVQNECK